MPFRRFNEIPLTCGHGYFVLITYTFTVFIKPILTNSKGDSFVNCTLLLITAGDVKCFVLCHSKYEVEVMVQAAILRTSGN